MTTTRISEDSPLNLWLANTRADLYAARIHTIEMILDAAVSDRGKLASIRAEIQGLRRRQDAAAEQDTYEGQVDALTRE